MNTVEQFVDALIKEHGSASADAAVMREYRANMLARVYERVRAEMTPLLTREQQEDLNGLLDVRADHDVIQEFFFMNIPTYQNVLSNVLADVKRSYAVPTKHSGSGESAPKVPVRRIVRHDEGVEAQARFARRVGSTVELAGNDGLFREWIVDHVVHGTETHDVIFRNTDGTVLALPAREAERREEEAVRGGGARTVVRIDGLPGEERSPEPLMLTAAARQKELERKKRALSAAYTATPLWQALRRWELKSQIDALTLDLSRLAV